MPPVTRNELNRAGDIIREVGLKKMKRTADLGAELKHQRSSGCDGNARHTLKQQAEFVAGKIKGRTVYRCIFCHSWHVGNKAR